MVLEGGGGIGSSRQGEAEAAWEARALFGSTRSPSLHSKEPPLHPNSIFFLPENSPSRRLTQGIDCRAFTQAFCTQHTANKGLLCAGNRARGSAHALPL